MTSAYDMLYLISCTINGEKPDKNRISAMDLLQLYRTSKFHLLNAICCIALEDAGINDEIMKQFKSDKNKAIRKNLLLDTDRLKLQNFLDESGIWYMPLKGIILKELYPKLGMRQMSDNDILYDAAFGQTVCGWFIKNGYKAESIGKSHHDIYIKPPVYNYEMHTELFSGISNTIWRDYYKNVTERLITDSHKSCRYHFSDEDFYIYIVVHTYKHFEDGGIGLRSVLDTYVYLKEKGSSLKFEYIKAECEKLGIADFERRLRNLAVKVFGNIRFEPDYLSEEEISLLEYFFYSGAYGTKKNAVVNRMKKYGNSKLDYILSRMFPDRTFMQNWCYYNAGPLGKSIVLLPIAYIWRLIYKGITSFSIWREELKVLKNLKL